MGAPSQAEIEQMRHLRAIMEGAVVDLPSMESPVATSPVASSVDDGGVSAMKDILVRFNQSMGEVAPIESAEPQVIEPKWEVIEVSGNIPSFKVAYGNLILANNLAVVDAAELLRSHLASGGFINDQLAVDAMLLDAEYQFTRSDAVLFKKKTMDPSADATTKANAEKRYQETRKHALSIREKIKSLGE